MILRKLAIGVVSGAIVVAMIVASDIVMFDRPVSSRDKPIESASAQQRGGVLRVFQYDSPASMSIPSDALRCANARSNGQGHGTAPGKS